MRQRHSIFRFFSIVTIVAIMMFGFCGGASANTGSIDMERGSAQYLSISDGAQNGLDFQGDFSISVWINLESFPVASFMFLANKTDYASNQSYRIFILNEGGTHTFCVGTSSNGSYMANRSVPSPIGNLATNTWYHIVIAYEAGSSKVYCYVNEVSAVITGLTSSIYNSSAPFLIGNNGFGESYFDGKMDEYSIWNKTLSSEEVSDLYDNGDGKFLNVDEVNLISYWRFDQDSNDMTSRGNHLTTNNGPVYSDEIAIADTVTPVDEPELETVATECSCQGEYIDVVSIPDMDNNTYPENAGLGTDENGQPTVCIIDTDASVFISQILFFDNNWEPTSINFVADADGNGSPGIMVMASNLTTGEVRARTKGLAGGELISDTVLPSSN